MFVDELFPMTKMRRRGDDNKVNKKTRLKCIQKNKNFTKTLKILWTALHASTTQAFMCAVARYQGGFTGINIVTAILVFNCLPHSHLITYFRSATTDIKGIVHPKMKMLSSFTHPHVVRHLYAFLSYVEHKSIKSSNFRLDRQCSPKRVSQNTDCPSFPVKINLPAYKGTTE